MTDQNDKLLVEGMQELYYAEQKLADAQEKLAEQTSDETASQAFSEHHNETLNHVERLEQAFEALGEEPQEKTERVVDALIEEHEDFAEDNEGEVLDRYNLAVAQKVEHYEIAAYGNVTSLADKHGLDDVSDLLSENLSEEEQALDEVTQASEQFDQQQVAGD
jgi:ferritin-like metal-binding protein YciE